MEKIKFKPIINATTERYKKGLKFLFLDPKYLDLNFKSKALANIIYNETQKDTNIHTIKVDCDGLPYISFTNKYLAELLKCSVNSLKGYKEELFKHQILINPKTNKKRDLAFNMDIEVEDNFKYLDPLTNEIKFIFFEIPDFIFHSTYKHFSLEAIYIYSLIRERNKISYQSTQNHSTDYLDKDGFIFCYYSNEELLKHLNIKNRHTIKKHKNMLIAMGLLREGHEARRYPDGTIKTVIRFYAFEPINLTDENSFEIIEVEDIDFSHLEENLTGEKTQKCQNLSPKVSKNNAESVKIYHQKCQNLTTKESTKENIKEIYKENSDNEMSSVMNNVSNTTSENVVSLHQHNNINSSNNLISNDLNDEENMIDKEVLKDLQLQHFSTRLVKYLKNYNYKDLKLLISILCHSKNEINAIEYTDYRVEDFETTIINTLNKLKRENRIKQESIFARRKKIKTYINNAMNKQVEIWVKEKVNDEQGYKF